MDMMTTFDCCIANFRADCTICKAVKLSKPEVGSSGSQYYFITSLPSKRNCGDAMSSIPIQHRFL